MNQTYLDATATLDAIPEPRIAGAQAPPRLALTRRGRRLFGGGTDGNEHLTAVTGTILLVLFAILGISIIRIGQLMWLHLFLGTLLLGPVALKLASTGYRFASYYTHRPAYVRKGPPHPLMRMLGPVVLLSTVGVFLTGGLLLIEGPSSRNPLGLLHKVFFFLWLASVGVHVLGHLLELPQALQKGREQPLVRSGSLGRGIAIGSALAGGVVLALLFLPDFAAWTSGGGFHGH